MKTSQHYNRILAVAPFSRGFGFAVLENGQLVDSGIKAVRGNDKNGKCLEKIKGIFRKCEPDVLVLEDTRSAQSDRAPRIRELNAAILGISLGNNVPVAWFTKTQLKNFFFGTKGGTKHEIAQEIARRFPEELGHRLPRERRLWDSQDERIDLFFAVALAQLLYEATIAQAAG